jgi:hypothetical protein
MKFPDVVREELNVSCFFTVTPMIIRKLQLAHHAETLAEKEVAKNIVVEINTIFHTVQCR